MTRLLLYSLALVASIIAMIWTDKGGVPFALASGMAAGFAIPLIDTALVNGRFLRIAWYSIWTATTRVRVSASYLFRIRVDSHYLLIKGKRFDQYQPVGGVYKAYPSSSGRRSDLNVLDDSLLVPDAVSEGDLRVRLPGRHLLAFVRWFEEGRGREIDGWREFFEELVASGILPHDAFAYVKYDVVRRHYHPLRYSPWAESRELLIADVLELIPTTEQLSQLRALKSRTEPRVLWATEDQIRRRGAVSGAPDQTTRIAETAEWTI